ncbi:MAG: ATP-grasp domain-containing protein [Acidobacteriota bacterium]
MNDNASKRVLLLLPTSSYRAHDFLAAAERVGAALVVGTNRKQALQDLAPGTTIALDFDDPVVAVATIIRFAESYPLAAVVGGDDETTELAALAAAALGLPHNPREAVAATRNKLQLRELLQRSGLPSPGFRTLELVSDPGDGGLAQEMEDLAFPCVLKPTFLAASRGVISADDAEQFIAARRRIEAILAEPEVARFGGDEASRILVEDYIPGEEYAVEAILTDGQLHLLAIFDKPDPLEGPYFEETIYLTPSRAAESLQQQIVHSVKQAVAAIGLREGPVHAELRVNDAGAYLIDIAARAIGGLCPRVLRFGTGMSLEELILCHATGRDVASLQREPLAAGVMMIPIPEAGVLEEVAGIEAAEAVGAIEAVTLSIPCGQQVRPLPEGNRYLGFIIARDASVDTVEAALRQAHRLLEIKIT